MNGLNRLFMTDPVSFLETYCVDNVTMQRSLQGAKDLTQLNNHTSGAFDLVEVENVENQVRLIYPKNYNDFQEDDPLYAYWCPFLAGNVLPGYVDVSRANPTWSFIFTAAMQGCAFAITDSPKQGRFRVYHNQHPTDKRTWEKIQKDIGENGKTISTFDYTAYGSDSDTETINTFNIVWKQQDSWYYVSQSNLLMKDLTVGRANNKPILKVAAKV